MTALVTRSGGMERFRVALSNDDLIAGALNETALKIRQRSRKNVRKSAGSGRIYLKREPFRGGKEGKYIPGTRHQASAPGEFPADYTGYLADRIKIQKAKGKTRKYALVIAAAPHAHLLEFGTVNMRPRPFMGPAVRETKPEYKMLMARAADKAVKKAAKAAQKAGLR